MSLPTRRITCPARATAATALAVSLLLAVATRADDAAPAKGKLEPPKDSSAAAKQPAPKLGLAINDPKAFQGYTLIAPMTSTKTYLIDMQGKVVKSWQSDCRP